MPADGCEVATTRGDPGRRAHDPEDRLGTGLAPSLSVTNNVVIEDLPNPLASRWPLFALQRMRETAVAIIGRYDVKTPGRGLRCATFPAATSRSSSWGDSSQTTRSSSLDQPTRGLDVGAIETVHWHLREAAAKGVAIRPMSEHLDEICALADRILVIYEGTIVGELPAGSSSVEEIGSLMAGGTRGSSSSDVSPSPGGCPLPCRSARSSSPLR